ASDTAPTAFLSGFREPPQLRYFCPMSRAGWAAACQFPRRAGRVWAVFSAVSLPKEKIVAARGFRRNAHESATMNSHTFTETTKREAFITGGTGFMGARLIAELLRRGHAVRALTREGSAGKLPPGCRAVIGNALEKESYAGQVRPADTFVQLVG